MRSVGILRVALGGLLLGRPMEALRLARTSPSSTIVALTRLLGARYAVQGSLDVGVPHDRRLDAAVEGLHAASMLAIARSGRPHARLARISAGVAAAFAVMDLATHHTQLPRPTTPAANPHQDGDNP